MNHGDGFFFFPILQTEEPSIQVPGGADGQGLIVIGHLQCSLAIKANFCWVVLWVLKLLENESQMSSSFSSSKRSDESNFG